jgi:hypothetical protein
LERSDVREFHYICRIENIRSILAHGILSFDLAQGYNPVSFALATAQARRAVKYPTPGRSVHGYANLYFDAHNPALSKRRDQNPSLAVLTVARDVLDLPGAMIATMNAAAGSVEFYPSPDGLANLDAEIVYARYWLHDDPAIKEEHGRMKCAEILVPDRVECRHITGAYVASASAAASLSEIAPDLPVEVWRHLFF